MTSQAFLLVTPDLLTSEHQSPRLWRAPSIRAKKRDRKQKPVAFWVVVTHTSHFSRRKVVVVVVVGGWRGSWGDT